MLIGLHASVVCVILVFCKADGKTIEKSQVEVRAVFLKCEPEDRQSTSLDSEVTRFEREEMYKHTALRDCNKKIALTVKMTSEPAAIADDEYIPIEHVFQGYKRIRLLDPYVLRLRREPPLQAYKLRKIDTVNGVLTYAKDSVLQRYQRSYELLPNIPTVDNSSYSSLVDLTLSDVTGKQITRNNKFQSKCPTSTFCPNKRDKRFEHNIMIENVNDDRIPPLLAENHLGSRLRDDIPRSEKPFRELNKYHNERDTLQRQDDTFIESNVEGNRKPSSHFKISKPRDFVQIKTPDVDEESVKKLDKNNRNPKPERYFTVYEIDKPDLWSTVQVQLFEKLNTPEGKNLWNDLSKGEPASVSSLSPEWNDQDMNVRYRAEWVPREDFSLPITSMCLLTPYPQNTDEDKSNSLKCNYQPPWCIQKIKIVHYFRGKFVGEYIVVPREDILAVDNTRNEVKMALDSGKKQGNEYRRVMVRMSRALIDSNEDKLNMESHHGDQYLTMPYTRSHKAQIDLEARADENQLVNIGSTGRIIMAVSDNTRRTRTILNVQVMNTGLTSARFRVKPRDCGPPQSLESEKGFEKTYDNALLLPPRHTRHVRIVLPDEIPSDIMRCSVALVSDDGDSVAVRDVSIKRGDRCFCVWHCECVCLSEDPKLLCQEMPEARQVAAGLSLRERPRNARSVCYHDDASVNILVTVFGVLMILLLFGVTKAFLGLFCRCIGSFGLHRILQMPRKLTHYYESSLRDVPVAYDDEGWPVHPETRERTVRLISLQMEFVLNIVFFIVAPGIVLHEAIKQMCVRCQKLGGGGNWKPGDNDKNIFSSHDMQCVGRRRRRRRRGALRQWMTTEAEELSSNVWRNGLLVQDSHMRPLVRDETVRKMRTKQESRPNSDEDDTEFVLMQMQKSRESLAKSQKSQVGAAAGLQSNKTHRR